MAVYSNRWHFFNKKAIHINPDYDEGIWYADIHFDIESAGLHTVEHIFILEEYKDESTGEIKYCQPRGDGDTFLRLRWNDINPEIEYISMFQMEPENDILVINKVTELKAQLVDGSSDVIDDDRRVLNSSSITTDALQFNFTLHSPDERTCDRILLLETVDQDGNAVTVADFIFRGETIGEDERFRHMLDNFARSVSLEDFHVFRDVDINEESIDYIKLNTKRKELLLEGDSIYSYVGSYKGLVNALKFFGYSDLRLKEYWLNIDEASQYYGTYKHTEIKFHPKLEFPSDYGVVLPSKQYKKTAKFGLFYDVTKTTGRFDEYGLPITERAFMFTNEEVLIKLFSLKELLKREFLPLNARIVDITGEGIYFEKYRVNSWSNKTSISEIEFDVPVSFSVNPQQVYIEDLRDRFEYTCTQDISDEITIATHSDLTISEISRCEIKDLVSIGNIDNLPYQSRYKVGAVVTLQNESFVNVTWNELTVSWDSLDDVTWDSLGKGEIFEIEWRVSKKTEKLFSYVKRGTSEEISTHEIILPYEGFYDVTLVLYDTQGRAFSKTAHDFIEVRTVDADMIGFYRKSEENLTWNDAKFTWTEANFSWDYQVRTETSWNDIEIKWDSFNYLNHVTINGIQHNSHIFSVNTINRDSGVVIIGENISNYISNIGGQKSLLLFRDEGSIPVNNTAEVLDAYFGNNNFLVLLEGIHQLDSGDYLVLYLQNLLTDDFVVDIEKGVVIIDGDFTNVYYPGNQIILREEGNSETEIITIITDLLYDGTSTTLYLDTSDEELPGVNYSSIETEYDFHNFEIISYTTLSGNTLVKINSNTRDFQRFISVSDSYQGKWGVYVGEYSIPIKKINIKNDNTTEIILDDQNGELFHVTKQFRVKLAEFDLDYAQKRYGIIEPFKWESMDSVTWDDLKHITWHNLEYHGESVCGFKIMKVVPSGSIQIDNDPVFFFSDTIDLTLDDAVEELNKSSLPGISLFQYYVIPQSPDAENRHIHATAKYPGSTGLVHIRFSEGVEGDFCGTPYEGWSYPFHMTLDWTNQFPKGRNNPPLWNHLYRRFLDHGEVYPPVIDLRDQKTFEDVYKAPYASAIDGSLSLKDIVVEYRSFTIPLMTTLFVVADNCKVPAQKNHLWKLFHDDTEELLIIANEKCFIWTFDKTGSYSIELTVEDVNGNTSVTKKNSWVTVFK